MQQKTTTVTKSKTLFSYTVSQILFIEKLRLFTSSRGRYCTNNPQYRQNQEYLDNKGMPTGCMHTNKLLTTSAKCMYTMNFMLFAFWTLKIFTRLHKNAGKN